MASSPQYMGDITQDYVAIASSLKPCPFCGALPNIESMKHAGHPHAAQIVCSSVSDDCPADLSVFGEDLELAVERWNQRRSLPALRIASSVATIDGCAYMRDGRGALVPAEMVKASDKLIDELVRKVMGYAVDLSDQIGRFRAHTVEDFDQLQALLEQEYKVKTGGTKGNLTYTSYDGTLQIRLQVADNLVFGPELQAAKKLIDECLVGWSEGTGAELRALVTDAFNVEKEGLVSPAAMWRLLRLDITDPRWVEAMRAIRDSVRVVGSKRYVRFYRRANASAKWEAVSIDVASV